MPAASCPQCGADISFRSTALPVKVCDFCRSVIVRRGEALELAGSAATVPDDVSPLQIGTRGQIDGDAFELIGRIRWKWAGGGWNEWFMLFAGGSTGWLGDAMGRFMALREVAPQEVSGDAIERLIAAQEVMPGMTATIAGVSYAVTDARTVTCVASEGELPHPAPAGMEMFSVDLGTPTPCCASVQREGETVFAYAGRYCSLGDIKPANLRAIEGWTIPDFSA